MIKNRSVPADTMLVHLVYDDVLDAAEWLTTVFGFAEYYRYGDEEDGPAGIQMHLGDAWIMLRSGSAEPGGCGQVLTIFVPDVDTHFEHARSAGAKIVEELHETMYGERQYGVEDLSGRRWLFATHAKDVSPEEWGAKVAQTP